MKLSIITINYNNKAGMEKTIASVMSQTWRGFEWIIIDGGSNDGSKEIIEELAKNPTANISYWCSEKDKGVYNAMNKGIARCSGDYICCMNSGDIFYEETTLQKVFDKKHTADILYGDWNQVYDDHEKIMRVPADIDLYFFYTRNICQQAMFVKTSMLKENGFDESYKILGDYERWFNAAINGATFEHLGIIVCHYNMDGISSTQKEQRRIESRRIKDSLPKYIRLTLERCDDFIANPYILKTRQIADKGGFKLKLLRIIFFIIDGRL